jgi:Ca2+-binding EF-hand superfamily protein
MEGRRKMKRFILPGLAAVAIVTGAVAYAQTEGSPGHRGHMMFEMLDANKDGTVTRAEATAAAEKHFAEVDTNKDGVISQAERDAMRARMRDKMFDLMDSDKNGQLSREEFRAAHEKMRAAKGERGMQGMQGMHRGGHHGGMRGGGMMKADTTKAQAVARAQAMFDRIDANRDGNITAAERDAARQKMKDMRQSQQPEAPKN